MHTPKNIAAMPIRAGTMMIACNNVPGLFNRDIPITVESLYHFFVSA